MHKHAPSFFNFHPGEMEGTLINIVNGLRLGCLATLNPIDPPLPFYSPEICYPRDPASPYKYPCQPLYFPGDGFLDSISVNSEECYKPGDYYPYCYLTYTTDVHVTFYPNSQDLMTSFLRNYVEFTDGDPFDPGYLFNLLDNPEFLSHMAYVLGISSTSLLGDYGYVVVHIDKNVDRTKNLDLSQSVLNQQRKTDFINDLTAAVTDEEIVQLMSEYGTHYLAGITTSDIMLQTFVYTKQNYLSVEQKWEDDSGKTDGANFIKYVGTSYATHVQTIEMGNLKTFADDLVVADSGYACNVKSLLIDTLNGLDRSIFKFKEHQATIEGSCPFYSSAQTKLRFGSLTTLLLGGQYPALKEKWDRVMTTTLTHKFGLSVNENRPDFLNQLTYPSQATPLSFYDSFNPSIVTHTGSVYTSILQMYYNLNDLDTDISNPGFVEHMFIMADVIEIGPDKATVPGSATVHIICRHLISHSTSTTYPTLYVDTDDVNISAEEITGVLQVLDRSTNSSYTYYNELVHETIDDAAVDIVGAHTVKIYQVLQATSTDMPTLYVNDPNDKLSTFLHVNFYEGHEIALVTTEVILSLGIATDQDSIPTALKCLNWISNTLNQHEDQNSALSFEQEEILSRVLLLKTTRVPFYLSGHVLVPRLTYNFYKSYYDTVLNLVDDYEKELQAVNSNIATQLAAESIAQNQQQLNENIIEIGKFLVGEATANRDKEEDMKNAFNELIELNNQSIVEKQAYADQLFDEIQNLQYTATQKGKALEDCVRRETIISLLFTIIDVVSILFPTPGAPGPAAIPETISKIKIVVEKIQKVVKLINQIKQVMESLKNIRGTISTMNRAMEGLENIQGGLDEFPTKVEWDDYDGEIAQYTAPSTVPSNCAGDAADFKAASNKISSRGRVYLETMTEIEKLQYEVISLTLQKDTAERHAERLDDLSNSLDQTSIPLEVIDSSNLYEIGYFIQMHLNAIRLDLAQIYINMDAALQHYYLQDASPFSGYTTRAIFQASKDQMKKAETALNNFDNPPSEFSVPFVFDIQNVNVNDLFSLAGITYSIEINHPIFLAYQRVRVLEVRAWIDNLATSTYDRVQVDVLASGEFEDRDASNDIRQFASEPLTFPFIYEISTKTIILDNRPLPVFDLLYMKITPFTDWIIRINPDHPNNVGLQFTSTLANIRLEMYLSAVVSVSG